MKKLVFLLIVVLSVTMCASALATELPIVDTPVTLTVWAGGAGNAPDLSTNLMTLEFERRTGVHIEWIHEPTETATKLNLSLASGEYPDIYFVGFSSAQVMLNANAGIFLPLNDLIDSVGVNYKGILESDPFIKENVTAAEQAAAEKAAKDKAKREKISIGKPKDE